MRKLKQRWKHLFAMTFVFAASAALVACQHGSGGY